MDNVTRIWGLMQGFVEGGCDSCVEVVLGVPGTETAFMCTWYLGDEFVYLVQFLFFFYFKFLGGEPLAVWGAA